MGAYSSAVTALSPGQFLELQEAAGPTADDSSTHNRDGTYNDPVTYQQASLLAAEPSDKSVLLAAGASVTTTYDGFTGSITATGWARRNDTLAGHPLIGSTNGVLSEVLLRCTSGDTSIDWWPDTNINQVTWATGTIPTASNFHWALTYVNATLTSELFINGVSKGTKVSDAGWNSPGEVCWGAWQGGDTLTGRMSHVAFFPTVLSSASILNLYNVGFSGLTAITSLSWLRP